MQILVLPVEDKNPLIHAHLFLAVMTQKMELLRHQITPDFIREIQSAIIFLMDNRMREFTCIFISSTLKEFCRK